MTLETDAARRRILETAEAINRQRKLVKALKANNQDATGAQAQLRQYEQAQAENMRVWRVLSGG
jgi:hypothetical protein